MCTKQRGYPFETASFFWPLELIIRNFIPSFFHSFIQNLAPSLILPIGEDVSLAIFQSFLHNKLLYNFCNPIPPKIL